MRQPPVIVAEHLRKRFYATQALDDVSLTLYPGEVHAVGGENGAGKSTLIKILGGIHQPDSGRVLVNGVERGFRNPREAMATGIVLIPQELRLVPAFTVAENVMLGHAPMRRALGVLPVVDRRRMRDGARPALERLGFTPDLDRRVDELPYSEQQLVAIAKALSREATVLILDEPTAALERREVSRLFDTIAALKAQGVAIIYISHRLVEVTLWRAASGARNLKVHARQNEGCRQRQENRRAPSRGSEADIEFRDGAFGVVGTDRRLIFEAIARAAHAPHNYLEDLEPGLHETAFCDPKNFAFSNGAHVSGVEVDPETGAVRIVGYWVVDDIGVVINPMVVEGQVQGGLAQGIGQALLEGCGESGAIEALACVVSAILDALAPLGVTDIEMPVTPHRIWQAIKDAKRSPARR